MMTRKAFPFAPVIFVHGDLILLKNELHDILIHVAFLFMTQETTRAILTGNITYYILKEAILDINDIGLSHTKNKTPSWRW